MSTKLRGTFSGPPSSPGLAALRNRKCSGDLVALSPIRAFSSVEKSGNQHRMWEVCSGMSEPRSPCHPLRELKGVPGEKYKRCPVCEHLWNKGREGRWDQAVSHFAPPDPGDSLNYYASVITVRATQTRGCTNYPVQGT